MQGPDGSDSTSGDDQRTELFDGTTDATHTEDAQMNDELEQHHDNEVEHDGMAMLGILVLAIILIVYVGYNVIS
jgi:hypothetical protein